MELVHLKMKKFIQQKWLLFLALSLSLGLAPFTAPHIIGKIKWLLGGNVFSEKGGMQLMDWFDVFLHGTPWLLLICSLILNLASKKDKC